MGANIVAMSHLTAPRAALAASLLAVVAPLVATNALIAFYLTFVALVGMMVATFLAYLEVVDRPTVGPVIDLVVCAGALLLVMCDAVIRFPTALGGSAPAVAGSLALAALVISAIGVVAQLAMGESRPSMGDLRDHLRGLRHPLGS